MQQLVYIIDVSEFGPGFHEIQFSGLNWHGNPLPTGIYFVLLQIGSEQSMIRMTLLR